MYPKSLSILSLVLGLVQGQEVPCRSEADFEKCLTTQYGDISNKMSDKFQFCSNLKKMVDKCEKAHLECNTDKSL